MNYRFIIVFFICLICLVLAVVVNVIYGIDIVYTHFFYLPIILTGIWYPRYAILLASAMGLIHVACDYATTEAFKVVSFLRAAMFIIVAYATSHLAKKRDFLFDELQTLNSSMLDMISKVDSNGLVEYVSPSVKTVLGYTPEQVKGKPFFDFIHPDESSAVKQKFQNAMETRNSFRMDYRCRCADGGYIWVESLANPIVGHQKGMNIYVFGSRDVTLRKQAEEVLEEERRRLQLALDEVRTLRGIVPICSYCKKIRDDDGYWSQVEQYVSDHTEAQFSHAICPVCYEKVMKELKS